MARRAAIPPLRRGTPFRSIEFIFIASLALAAASGSLVGPAAVAAEEAGEKATGGWTLDPPAGVGGDRLRPLKGDALEAARRPLERVLEAATWPEGLGPADGDNDEAGEARGGGEGEEGGDGEAADRASTPSEAAKLYAEARDAAQSRKWTEALDKLEGAMAIDARGAPPRLLAGRVYAQLGRRAPAIDALTEALRRDGGDADALYLFGRLHFEKGEHLLAAAALRRAVEAANERLQPNVLYLSRYFLGQSLLRLGRDAAASEALGGFLTNPRRVGRSRWYLRDLVLVGRQREIAQVQVGDAYMRLGRAEAALRHYAEADLSSRLGPGFTAGRRVYALMALGRSADALAEAVAADAAADEPGRLELVDYVVRHAPSREALVPDLRRAYERGERSTRIAMALADALPAEEAGGFLEEHLRGRPDDAKALARLGELWRGEDARKMMRLTIDLIRARPGRAASLAEAVPRTAAQAAEWAAALDELPEELSRSPAASYLRGVLALESERELEAGRQFDAAIEASPEFMAPRLAHARVLLDRAEEAGGAKARAALAGRAMARLDGVDEGDRRVRFLKARALATRGDVGEGAEILQGLLRRDRDNPEYIELKARMLRQVGRFDRAEETLVALIEARPRREAAYRALFALYERHRPNPKKFAELVAKAEARMPGGRLTRLKRARLLTMQGKAEEGLEVLRGLVREDPDDGEALAAYTVALGRRVDWAEAGRMLESLLDADPTNKAALTMFESVARLLEEPARYFVREAAYLRTLPRTWDTMRRFAGLYERWGKPEKAIEAIDEALSYDPPSPGPLHLRLARLHQRAGRFSAALEAMERAIEARPDEPHYAVVKAWILQEADRVDDAVETLAAAAEAHPDASVDLRVEKARLYAAADRRGEASAVMARLVEAHPDRAAELYYMQSLLPGGRADAKETERLLLKSIEADPDYAPANNDLGYTWADAGRNLKRAESMIRKAVAASPDNAAYLDSLGWVLYKRDMADQAVRWLSRAAEVGRNDPVILDHLGDAHWRAGNREDAVGRWRAAERRLVGVGDALSEEEAAVLAGLRAKLEAVDAGREPRVAPVAGEGAGESEDASAASPRAPRAER